MGNDGGGDDGWSRVITGDDEDDENFDVERQSDILCPLASSKGTVHFAGHNSA